MLAQNAAASEHLFVGREREIGRLQAYLDQALAGRGQVVFVVGEAGSGKTALVREFARRAELANAELVVAAGNCNAQTGMGDPYLPFREVLALLTTGGLESRAGQGAMSPENAARLRSLVSRSVQVLVEVGPDLVDVVVPGSKLIASIGKAVAEKVGWLDDLERLATMRSRAEFSAVRASSAAWFSTSPVVSNASTSRNGR